MSRSFQVLSLLLGILMFLFGVLKFFPPFDGWFEIQIQQSHLPHQAILAGKLGEIFTGCLFLLPWLWRRLDAKRRDFMFLAASLILIVQMVVAIYVQLQPQVPADVLPLAMKPPVIPGIVLFLALLTSFHAGRALRAENKRSPQV